jgi:hypothetical protein
MRLLGPWSKGAPVHSWGQTVFLGPGYWHSCERGYLAGGWYAVSMHMLNSLCPADSFAACTAASKAARDAFTGYIRAVSVALSGGDGGTALAPGDVAAAADAAWDALGTLPEPEAARGRGTTRLLLKPHTQVNLLSHACLGGQMTDPMVYVTRASHDERRCWFVIHARQAIAHKFDGQ